MNSRGHHPTLPPTSLRHTQVVSFTPGADLAREVFRVYLGDPPVSQEAKIRLASEVLGLLKEQQQPGGV